MTIEQDAKQFYSLEQSRCEHPVGTQEHDLSVKQIHKMITRHDEAGTINKLIDEVDKVQSSINCS